MCGFAMNFIYYSHETMRKRKANLYRIANARFRRLHTIECSAGYDSVLFVDKTVFVYDSVFCDNEKNEKNWKNISNFNNLKGGHFLFA